MFFSQKKHYSVKLAYTTLAEVLGNCNSTEDGHMNLRFQFALFLALFIYVAWAHSLLLSEERVQRIPITQFSQVVEVVQTLHDKGFKSNDILGVLDWDCTVTENYFRDDRLNDPMIPEHIGKLKALMPLIVLTGRWIDEKPDGKVVEKLIRAVGKKPNLPSIPSPLDVFYGYYNLTPTQMSRYCTQHDEGKSHQLSSTLSTPVISHIAHCCMEEQTKIKLCDQDIFHNLNIDLRDNTLKYGFFSEGFCFTNGQIDPALKAQVFEKLLSHHNFPFKPKYIVYIEDDIKFVKALERMFKNRPEHLITLHLPNKNSS
jgi:hypothetical protein